jgi:uncharacterized protein (DUF2249 family)
MNGEAATASERIIDVRDIAPRFRHQIIRQLVDHLAPDASIQLIADHPPQPLRYQLELWFGDRCKWLYLEEGPDVWRVRISKPAATAASA